MLFRDKFCFNCSGYIAKEDKVYLRSGHTLCEKCNSIDYLDYCKECGIFWEEDDIKCCA